MKPENGLGGWKWKLRPRKESGDEMVPRYLGRYVPTVVPLIWSRQISLANLYLQAVPTIAWSTNVTIFRLRFPFGCVQPETLRFRNLGILPTIQTIGIMLRYTSVGFGQFQATVVKTPHSTCFC